MSTLQSFNPSYGQGKTVSPAAASASTTITGNTQSVCFTNTGANICYVKIGVSGITASTADFPILAGHQVSLTKKSYDDTVAYISASGTTLHIITGEGLVNV